MPGRTFNIALLVQIDASGDFDSPLDATVYRRHQVVQQSMAVIHKIIDAFCEGPEEPHFILGEIAQQAMRSAIMPIQNAMHVRDLASQRKPQEEPIEPEQTGNQIGGPDSPERESA